MSLQLQHICLLVLPLHVESCYDAATATYMPAGLVLLSQTPLLFNNAYWMSAAARWCGHSISMPADLLSLNIACLLALCFPICYTCWYGVSLSAMSAGMVYHYQSCLLVWCFFIGHTFWFCTSLSAMPVDVVPHYRSCLLVWCLTIISKKAKIRNRYNKAPHLTQDTNGKVTTSPLDITNESQEASPFPAGDHKASSNRHA